ncbi:hypothetical protein [Rhodothermus marinus]|uniref:Exostosin family protein n=1 Tax=Rhodothermus marinus (strain ATCC 43812 / DSM 4252 / R-10) TaxID=518766 RepID=D0MHS6_RHOM4|nr:hypothetical protein [Rhodothermus marinus]ACY48034.1 hypothetical protein Rmar_1143 [Rhodothermus marinus DSM 4252]
MRAPNQYYRCLGYRETPEPMELSRPPVRPSYLHRVLQVVESELEGAGLTFFVTWKLDVLPEYGDHVVAIVMGDEWSQIPAYVDRVLVTFKCYGIYPRLGVRPLRRPSYLNTLVFLRHLRVLVHWFPGAVRHAGRYLKRRLQGGAMPPVYDLPLGYGNQLPLPVQPIETRPIDLFFAGSVEQGFPKRLWSPHRWLPSPKRVSRERMLRTLEVLQRRFPELRIFVHTNARFVLNALEYGLTEPGEVLDTEAYSQMLMDSKICLAPRGTSADTFRLFEGLRYGCVVITERLPARWFYRNAPVVQIDDWRELHRLVPELLGDARRLQELSQAALHWWRTVASEEAIGRWMAERIRKRRQQVAMASSETVPVG